MALALFDRVQETTTTTGTGSITLGGAVPGFQSFAAVGNGNTCYYTIVDVSAWEVGVGTYSTSGPTLARTTILSNSNGNTTAITLSAGTKSVFLTYPAGKSVNLNESGNVSPLGTVSSGVWQGTTVGVAYGGTGVTASSGANSVVLRDASQNITVNRINQGLLTTTASGGTTTLTAASAFNQALVGTGGHTYRLPDATTLSDTTTFQFNNNATGTLTIENNAGTAVGTIASGGAAGIALLSNATVGGTWDVHAYIPENVTWGTNSLALGSTVISGGTWNGGTIATGYGGTGLTSYTSGGAVYANSSTTLTSGTLPISAGGTGNTSGQAASTASSVTFNNGGAGGASGSTFNGSGALTVSYNTIGAPSVSGTNATGTWGISISGNAATATLAATATSAPSYLPLAGGTMSGPLTLYATSGSNSFINGTGDAATLTTYNFALSGWNGMAFYNPTSGGSYPNTTSGVVDFRNGIINMKGGFQVNGSTVLYAGNYNSYAPTLTGTGATGTWAINISGNAATATLATSAITLTSTQSSWGTGVINNVIGMLAWKNYGNGHVIFDASASTSPSGGAVDRTNANVAWSASYPTLMGWNGSSTYGVRVDSARVADSAGAVDYNALTNKGGGTGSYITSGDYRAPIFYDSNNTGYYLDPASTSNILKLYVGGATVSSGYNGVYATNMVGAASGNKLIYLYNDGSNIKLDSYDYGVGGALNINIGGNGGYTTIDTSTRSPIFYDSNDTGYYVDPNGNSKLYYLQLLGSTAFDGSTSLNVTNNAYIYGRAQIIVTGRLDSGNDGWAFNGRNSILFNINNGGAQGAVGTTNFALQYNMATGQFGVMTANSSSAPSIYWSNANANTYLNGGLYAPIFYDIDNTAFYFDPGGNSYLNATYFDFAPSTVNFRITTGPGTFNIGDDDIVNLGTSASARSPIFYDYNNTAYYVDPASTSNLYVVDVYGKLTAGFGVGRPASLNGSNWAARIGANDVYLVMNSLNDSASYASAIQSMRTSDAASFPLFLNPNGGNVGINTPTVASAQLHVRASTPTSIGGVPGGVTMISDSSTNNYLLFRNTADNGTYGGIAFQDNNIGGYVVFGNAGGGGDLLYVAGYGGGQLQQGYSDSINPGARTTIASWNPTGLQVNSGDMRAPIYYDSNNTAYYVDPASTSNLNALVATVGTFTNDGSSRVLYLKGSGNIIQFCDADGTFRWENVGRNGTYYVYKGYGTGAGYKWQIDDSGNQTFNGIVTFNTDARAPIFYDSNDTTYYLDPNSTGLSLSSNGIVSSGTGTNGGFQNRTYTSGRNRMWSFGNADGYGMSYFQGGPDYIGLHVSGSPTQGGSDFWVSSQGISQTSVSSRAPIFYDSNDTGYYVDPNGSISASFAGQINSYRNDVQTVLQTYNTSAGSPGQFNIRHDYGNVILENTRGVTYVYGSYVQTNNSLRAPIFYDTNNTAYFCDPTSVSNFDGLTVNNSITGYVNGARFNSDSETQANITNRVTSGFWEYSAATTALGWPVNSSSWQHLLACTHSNDNNYYSMQLAATFFDQGLFYRSTNGNGSTGWSRLVMYGNNYGSSIYGTIFYDSDNTAYYVDPAGGSRTGGINADSLYSYGNVTAYSDERLKTDWEVLPSDFVEKLAKVKSGTYTRIDSGERQVGVGAQSLQVILKEAVSEDQEYLGVNYGSAALASAVELAKYVTALEQRISQLEARL